MRPSKSLAASLPRPMTAHRATSAVTRSQSWTAIASPSTLNRTGPACQSTWTSAPG
ncbi:Uncharacterised protein [Mycobacteroides abscessus subsp. abscessus]|nr:Uncharacterised protein [Mycobacteroides abscessus subsp. abscessus]